MSSPPICSIHTKQEGREIYSALFGEQTLRLRIRPKRVITHAHMAPNVYTWWSHEWLHGLSTWPLAWLLHTSPFWNELELTLAYARGWIGLVSW